MHLRKSRSGTKTSTTIATKLKIDILTLFPPMCRAPLDESIVRRAQQAGHVEIGVHDIREFTTDKHRRADDIPYGGGQGMVMKPEPIFAAVRKLRTDDCKIILMTPQGRQLKQSIAQDYAAAAGHLILLCGHYEGIDHRVTEALVDDEISIGDYVLSNGAIAAVVFTDAIVRLIPGVLGDDRSSEEESFKLPGGLLEAPQYTRPPEFEGMQVPEVLLGGHHQKINEWKADQSRERTKKNRPDLLGE
ncbi:MAG: tRNA (guanine37-N1)-methyltransferase [Verrucomicrobiales bacterium]